ncbi:hypothetical protein FHX82_001243 [Amycolatopsis bartoniae]|uniref:DUF3558 domain-containing protein n=1 Tax=Amycolatopsis bartoniae TaxID=941986 RepID=A0A8H9M9H1_9PSEU|nr:DUF3558 domain-containing protein [Amycolatopsis bartoniae]MBB2934223.1 hypothetical protein [Amycolatopsis bartoniae]GHF48985.1 hypothetical protein GCM10017566_22890 [Amycolatopsis bartoniae]
MRKRKHVLGFAGLCTAAVLCVSCSQTTTGAPSATTDSTAKGSSAPKVPQELDPSSYLGKPCSIVPQQTMSQLGFPDPGVPNTTSQTAITGGPACDWYMPDSSKSIHVGIQRSSSGNDNGGIAKILSLNGSLFSFAELTDVSGYPAAYADTQDDRPKGACTLWVGIQDDLTFSVATDRYSGAQDSCDTAKQIAASVITTLQGGS